MLFPPSMKCFTAATGGQVSLLSLHCLNKEDVEQEVAVRFFTLFWCFRLLRDRTITWTRSQLSRF